MVVIDFVKIADTKKTAKVEKPETNLVSKVNEIGQVLNESTGSSSYFYKFYLRDASAATKTNSSSKESDSSLIKGATITISNKSAFHCGDSGSDYSFKEYDSGYYKIICQEAATMTIKISKSGYSTKTTTLAYYQGEIPTIYLSKYVAPPPPPPAPAETIKDVKLPAKFSESGGSTNLATVTDVTKVESLTLDTYSGTIKFKETVDLSSSATKDKFKELDKYVKAEQIGVVGIDSTNLPVLNKKATITMKALNFVKTPKIFVDGKEDAAVVSNITYKDGVLTFDVTHFSTFVAAATVGISEPANNFETNNKTIIVKGTVSDPEASVSAKLNNKDIGSLKVATTSGEFKKEVTLEEGLNKLVVSALSTTGATASATLAGTLLVKAEVNLVPVYLLLIILAIIGGFGIVWGLKHLKKNRDLKANDSKQSSPTSTSPSTEDQQK